MLLAETFEPQQLALMIPIIALGGAFLCAIVGIIMGTIHSTVEARAHEESRREIAAYVAEGSITPEDAAALLSAGMKSKGKRWACSAPRAASAPKHDPAGGGSRWTAC
jgi:hypothetical protein